MRETNEVLVNIVVEELVDDNVPFPIVVGKVPDSPPVFIKETISKLEKLSKDVHPAMEYSIEESK